MITHFTRSKDFDEVLRRLIGDRFLKNDLNFYSYVRKDLKKKLKIYGYDDISDSTPCKELVELLLVYENISKKLLTKQFYSDLSRLNENGPNIVKEEGRRLLVKYSYKQSQRLFPTKSINHTLKLRKLKRFCDENEFLLIYKLRGVSLGYLHRKVVSLTRINYIHGSLYFVIIFYAEELSDNYKLFFDQDKLESKIVSTAEGREDYRISVRPVNFEELKITLLKIKDWYDDTRMDTTVRVTSKVC